MQISKKIIGLGSPLLDIQAEVTQEFLDKYGLTLNNTYFAEEKHMPLYEELIEIPTHSHVPGGSALNTVRLAQWMMQGTNEQAKFIGCVGKDKFANMLIEVTNQDKVATLFDQQDQPTGKCAVLLHQKDRCLVPLIGAAAYLSQEYVDQHIEDIKSASVLFSEVYFLYPRAELTRYVYKLAQENGVKTCLTLSSVNAVSDKFDDIVTLLPYIDYLFGNEEEVLKFGQNLGFKEDLEISMKKIAEMPKQGTRGRVVVCTQGKQPTLVATSEQLLKFDIQLVDPKLIVDTNSAGDSFCGGYLVVQIDRFISELVNGDDLEKCARAGNYTASQTIQQEGSTLPKHKPQWE